MPVLLLVAGAALKGTVLKPATKRTNPMSLELNKTDKKAAGSLVKRACKMIEEMAEKC
jgi:hypothetical protein